MLKKTMIYTDYENVERTEDFYFNLTKGELTEMEFSVAGGMKKLLEQIVASQSTPQIFEMFKMIILKSYGEKSLDGKRFMKTKEITEGFLQTEAYSDLIVELVSDPVAAATFVNGVIPVVK